MTTKRHRDAFIHGPAHGLGHYATTPEERAEILRKNALLGTLPLIQARNSGKHRDNVKRKSES